MATLRITRKSEYVNRFRGYGVYVDGIKIGDIGNGETKDFQVGDGNHTIYTKVDWCSSPERTFTAHAGATTRFHTGAFKNSVTYLFIITGAMLLSSVMKEYLHYNIRFWVGLAGMAAIVYALTIRRKQYLLLEEENTENAYVPPARIGGTA